MYEQTISLVELVCVAWWSSLGMCHIYLFPIYRMTILQTIQHIVQLISSVGSVIQQYLHF